MQCQAVIEDFANGKPYPGLRRGVTVPMRRRCTRTARHGVGPLQLCVQHTILARDGLIDTDGAVAPRAAIRDVRRYPKKFPSGLYSWAHGVKATLLTISPVDCGGTAESTVPTDTEGK